MPKCDFIEITLQHGCTLVNLLHIFRKPFPKKPSGVLLLSFYLRIYRPTQQDWLHYDLRKSVVNSMAKNWIPNSFPDKYFFDVTTKVKWTSC